MHLIATLAILQQAYAPAVLQVDAPRRDQHTLRCTLRTAPPLKAYLQRDQEESREMPFGLQASHVFARKLACRKLKGGKVVEGANNLSNSEDLIKVNLTRILCNSIHVSLLSSSRSTGEPADLHKPISR